MGDSSEKKSMVGDSSLNHEMDKDINDGSSHTPPNFITQRNYKRPRESPGADFEQFKEDMRQMIQGMMVSHEKELQIITPTLLQIKESNANIESSLAFLASQTDELKKQVNKLEADKKEDREHINMLEEKMEDLQRENRKRNLKIKNVPKVEKESRSDLIKMVVRLSEAINGEISPSNIADVYRIRGRQDDKRNGPIIVELATVLLKTDFLQKCKQYNQNNPDNKLCARHLGFTRNEASPVYVSEQLTPGAARLRFLARDLAKSKSYKYCRTTFGRVFVRKNDTSRIIRINKVSEADTDGEWTILDYLSDDCWRIVLDCVPVRDVIRTECVSRHWQGVVLRYLRGVRIDIVPPLLERPRPENRPRWYIIDTNATQNGRRVTLTDQDSYSSFKQWTYKLGPSVVSAYCNSKETLEIYGNCPNLEGLTLMELGESDKILKCLSENFKWLRSVHLKDCLKITDHCISWFMTNNILKELKIFRNYKITGQCFTNRKSASLKSISLKQCFKPELHHLLSSDLSQVRMLALSVPFKDFSERIHLLLDKMPKFEHMQITNCAAKNGNFFKSVTSLSRLKLLDVGFEATDSDLEAVSRSCKELRSLELGRCAAITSRGVAAVCSGAGARLTKLGLLSGSQLTDDDVVACVNACPNLVRLDLMGCVRLSPALLPRLAAARREIRALTPLHLRVMATRVYPWPRQGRYEELVIYS